MRKRKILLINTYYKEKSTGSSCYDIVQAFNNEEYECKCIYFVNNQNYENTLFLGNSLEQKFHSAVSHIVGLEGYFSYNSTFNLMKFIDKYKPDAIHIFMIHSHVLNLRLLFNKIASLSVRCFVHLDDCWWFTGKCVHPTKHGCTKFCSKCHNCPALHDSPNSFIFDFSHKMQKDKFYNFAKIKDFKVLAVSEWLKEQAINSMILKDMNVIVLDNWIDENIFKNSQVHKTSSKKLLFVSSKWPKDGYKYKYLVALYEKLKDKFSFTVVGDTCENAMYAMNCVGEIKNPNKLAKYYQENDLYVHLSEFDTFGKVIMESVFCGTPVVAFDNTVMNEVIADCGLVAKNKDIEDLAGRIEEVFNSYDTYIQNCINRDLTRYTKSYAMDKLKEIYCN